MLNKKALSASVSAPETDDDFNQTVLLLHGDGTNGAQNNTFTDSSTNAFSITRNGNTTQGTFSPFSQTGWSNYFNGTTDYLTTSATQIIPTGDFTIEVFVFCTSSTTTQMIVSQASGTTSGRTGLYVDDGYYKGQIGSGGDVTTTTSPRLHQWDYVVLRRSGSTFELYVNGTLAGSSTNSNTPENTILSIGRNANWINTYYWNGYISNLKISNTAITVGSTSTSPLTSDGNTKILTCQSNTFKDNSSNAYSITINGAPSVQAFSPFAPSAAYSASTNGGSGYFDGSGDYLSTSTSQIIPTGSFTIEAWVYTTQAISTAKNIVSQGTGNDSNRVAVSIESSKWWFQIGSDVVNLGTPVLGQWNYVAMTFNGSTIEGYVNGVSQGTASHTGNAQNTTLSIGSEWLNQSWNGYIASVRISNTVRTVTTVPTSPFTSDANTRFLCNFTNAGIIDQTAKNVLETVGNAQIDTGTKKFGTGSLEFDGTGDYLVMAGPKESFAFGTGDFTIEFWIRLNSAPSASNYFTIYDSRPESVNGYYPTIYIYDTSATIYYLTNDSNRITGGNLSTNQWYHIALCRSGSSTKLFIDGTQSGSTYTDSNNYINATARPAIAVNGYLPSAGYLNGFMDDIRVTKGIARYTANFTVPSKAFPDQ